MTMGTHLRFALGQGLHAARRNLMPALVVQAVALGIVCGWYHSPALHHGLLELARLKAQAPWLYALLATSFFAGLIPGLVRTVRGEPRAARLIPWLMLFWGLKGLEINALYEGLAWLIGPGHATATVLTKVAIDQLLYAPLWAVPSTIVVYGLMEGERQPWRQLGQACWYRERFLPTAIANALLWIPTVAIIYHLPTALQLPLQNLVLCLWSLLLVILARGTGD